MGVSRSTKDVQSFRWKLDGCGLGEEDTNFQFFCRRHKGMVPNKFAGVINKWMNECKMVSLDGTLEIDLAIIFSSKKVSKDILPEVKAITLASLKSKEILGMQIFCVLFCVILCFGYKKFEKCLCFRYSLLLL